MYGLLLSECAKACQTTFKSIEDFANSIIRTFIDSLNFLEYYNNLGFEIDDFFGVWLSKFNVCDKLL